jgi:DNA helicase-2/ATP-dependent DNA helicase PcrA
MLFEILHFDWFNIPPVEIAKLSTAVADRRFGENKTSLRKLLSEKANTPPADLFSTGAPAGMKAAAYAIERLISDVSNVTLVNLVENCIREAGVLNGSCKARINIAICRYLPHLFDFVKEEARRNTKLTLEQLVNIFMLMEKEAISLPLVQVSGSDKGVNLLTVHGSKGLEFEHVFLAGCNASNWEKKRKPGGGYSFPDTMFSSQPKQRDEEELRRLFYVALTRAKQHLHISYSRFKNDGKELEPSMFIAEIQAIHALPVEKVEITTET